MGEGLILLKVALTFLCNEGVKNQCTYLFGLSVSCFVVFFLFLFEFFIALRLFVHVDVSSVYHLFLEGTGALRGTLSIRIAGSRNHNTDSPRTSDIFGNKSARFRSGDHLD